MNKTVLIVEDESIVALDIKNTLVKLGYEVLGISATGNDALEKCRQLSPQVVLMDIYLKGDIDGIETATLIQKEFSIPIIYLTAHADQSTLERAKITEPYGYVLKPFNQVELRIALELTFFKKYHLLSETDENNREPDLTDVPKDFKEVIKQLQSQELFSKVSKRSLQKMLNASSLKSISAGEQIIMEGENRTNGFLVISGRVALFKSSISGKELVVELINTYDLFGLATAIEDRTYTFSARTQIDSKVLFISRRNILLLLEEEPGLYRKFINLIAERLSHSHDIARSLAHDKVDIRIASALLTLLPPGSNSHQIIPIHITRKELADLTGTSVETSIRITKNMEQEGLLDLSQNSYIKVLKIPELRQLAEMN